MVVKIGTAKKSGGAALRLESQGSTPPGVLPYQRQPPPDGRAPAVNRMIRIQLPQTT